VVLLKNIVKWLILVAIVVAYTFLKFNIFHNTEALMFPDSDDYLRFPTWRPFTVPLIYNFFDDVSNIVWFQLIFSVFSWSFLAVALYVSIQPILIRITGVVLTLLFSLTHPVMQWDGAILSESLTFSLFVNVMAMFILIYKHYWHNKKIDKTLITLTVAVFLPLLFLFLNTRDANVYFLVLLVPLLWILFLKVNRTKRVVIYLSCITLGIAAMYIFQSSQMDKHMRWKVPLTHVIFERVLMNQQALAYFEKKGMLVNDAVLSFKGERTHELTGQTKQQFESWLVQHGKSTYQAYLITHPVSSIQTAIEQLPKSFNSGVIKRYYGQKVTKEFRKGLSKVYFFEMKNPYVWMWTLFLLPVVFFAITRRRFPLYVASLVFFGAFFTMAFVGYHGDAIEIVRHSLMADILFRMTLILDIVCILYFMNDSIRKLTLEFGS
jgi:hypothetical protein